MPRALPRSAHRVSLAAAALLVLTVLPAAPAWKAAAAGSFDPSLASPQLARAPYLTDLTQTSVEVTWATVSQGHGTLRWGPSGSCTQTTVSAGTFTQVNVAPTGYTNNIYQTTMIITGLAPSSTYCYRIFASDATDLLGASNPSATFTTLDPAGTASLTPLTFDVVGDLGDNTDATGVASPTSVNANQQAIDQAIAASGARFIVGVGDIAYQDGSQSNYGDLHETGTNAPGGTQAQLSQISNVFGPRYWAQIQGIPFFAADGNHGQNNNILRNWPETATASASSGAYTMSSYPAIDGASAGTYPDTWYAISSGNVRIYVLDASWNDGNVGTGNGGLCPTPSACAGYQLDHDQHWTTGSREYQWLQADLQSHPGGVKFAMFHYPLRADNATQPSDPYLQNTPSNPNSLEALLSANGVSIAFNGHAHLYQRNVAPGPGQLISYVTGGGGGKVEPVGTGTTPCSSTDAYAVGWSFTSGRGSACGAAPVPATPAAVYHFLKVTVTGTRVTVAPQNALGASFDVQTYNFGPPPGPVLSEGFESGGLAAWHPVVGSVSVQTATTHTGAYAAQLTSTGGQAYALRGLPAPVPELWTQVWVKLPAAPTTSVTLFGLRNPTQQVLAVYLRPGGTVTVRNNMTGVNYQGQTTIGSGAWHQVILHASITGGAFDLKVDGVTDAALTVTGQNLGASAFTTLQLGDDATGRTFSFYADDVLASTAPIVAAVPPILAEGFESGALTGWSSVVGGVSVTTARVHSGTYAAQITSSGGQAFALRSLGGSYTSPLYAQVWVNVGSQTTSATLFGLRSSTAQLVQVYLAANGQLKVRNNVTAVNYTGSLVVGAGWHRVTLMESVSGGTIGVALDGADDPALQLSGQNLGTAAVTTFQLGDDSIGRTFTWYGDDLSVSTSQPTS